MLKNLGCLHKPGTWLLLVTSLLANHALLRAQGHASSLPNKPALIDSSAAEQQFLNVYNNSGKTQLWLTTGLQGNTLAGSDIGYVFAEPKANARLGFNAGVVFTQAFSRHFALWHEAAVNQRGAGVKLSDSATGLYATPLTTLYLDLLPISPAYRAGSWLIYTGPYVSALLQATTRDNNINGRRTLSHTLFGTPDNFEEHQKYLQKFDYGWVLGATLQANRRWLLGIRYSHGLCDIVQFANSYTLNDPKTDRIRVFHRSLQLQLAYLIY